VRNQSGEKLIVCRPDGSIDQPWPNTDANEIRVVTLPGGGAAGLTWPRRSVYVLDANGNPFPELKISFLFPKASVENRFQVKRLAKEQLWVMANEKFIKFDLRNASHRVLADKLRDWSMSSTEEGVYFTRKGKIWLLDWNGKEQVITSATLN
jgi:hypothetical protein